MRIHLGQNATATYCKARGKIVVGNILLFSISSSRQQTKKTTLQHNKQTVAKQTNKTTIQHDHTMNINTSTSQRLELHKFNSTTHLACSCSCLYIYSLQLPKQFSPQSTCCIRSTLNHTRVQYLQTLNISQYAMDQGPSDL